MSEQTTEFAGKTWKRSGDTWIAEFEPPRELNLSIQPSIRIVGPRDFADIDGEGSAAEVTEEQKAAASDTHIRQLAHIGMTVSAWPLRRPGP